MAIKRRIKVTKFSTGRTIFNPQRKDTSTETGWQTIKDNDGADMEFGSQQSCEEFLRQEIIEAINYISIN